MKAFYHEQQVVVEGETLTLVINFRALDSIESMLDKSWEEIWPDLGAAKPKLSLVGKVLWGLLREKHAEMTLDQTASLMFGDTGVAIGFAVDKLIRAAFAPSEGEKAGAKNPPKRRGASKPS
jgi:hypothetical protein